MATSRRLRRVGFAVGALVCVAAATGCRTLTIPWEHPTAFKQTPACDSPGPCGDGCYVPPPPMLDSDCYGYRFTCWHPWPEHCRPQCHDGCESMYSTVAPQPVEAMPAMPESAPMMPMPPEPPPAAAPQMPSEETSYTPYTPPSSATTRHTARNYDVRNVEHRALPPGERNAPAEYNAASPPANYGFLNAVAQSPGTIHDDSVRPASRVTRLYTPEASPNAQPNGERRPTNNEDRFRW